MAGRRQSRTVTSDELCAFLAALRLGEGHARSAATIAVLMRLPENETGKRVVRACAQQAVEAGALVCSGQAGYYLAATPGEVAATCAQLRSQASALWKRARKAEEIAAERFDLRNEPEPEGERPALLVLMEA